MFKGNALNIMTTLEAIKEKYSEEESKKYIPNENCLTYQQWKKQGYKVKKGEKAVSKIGVLVENEKTERKFIKSCALFYYLQVEKI